VTVADMLEVGRIEIDSHDLASLALRLGYNEPPTDFAGELICRQVRRNEFPDRLDLPILRANMKAVAGAAPRTELSVTRRSALTSGAMADRPAARVGGGGARVYQE
jgi:hypothetical protein